MTSNYSYKKVNEFDVEDDSKAATQSQLARDLENRIGWLRKPSVSD